MIIYIYIYHDRVYKHVRGFVIRQVRVCVCIIYMADLDQLMMIMNRGTCNKKRLSASDSKTFLKSCKGSELSFSRVINSH